MYGNELNEINCKKKKRSVFQCFNVNYLLNLKKFLTSKLLKCWYSRSLKPGLYSCTDSQILNYNSWRCMGSGKYNKEKKIFFLLFHYSNHAFVSSLLLMKINLQSMVLYQPRWHKGQRYTLIKSTTAIDISHGLMRVWDLLIKCLIMFTHHKHFPCLSTAK